MPWLAALAVALVAAPPTIHVRSDAEFPTAVAALRSSGGTIVLLPRAYRQLVVPERSARPLRIVATSGARAERVLFDRTQRVSLEGLRLAPASGDASIVVHDSEHVELEGLVVSAEGTPYVPRSSFPTRASSRSCGANSRTAATARPRGRTACSSGTGRDTLSSRTTGSTTATTATSSTARFGSDLTIRGNGFERALPCRMDALRCGHQDLIELFEGQGLRVANNRFGVYQVGGAQLYLTDAIDHVVIVNNVFQGTDARVPGYRSRIGLVLARAALLDFGPSRRCAPGRSRPPNGRLDRTHRQGQPAVRAGDGHRGHSAARGSRHRRV